MKHILVAMTGLSPQVITETIIALHQRSQRVDAIHVIITRDGKEMIFVNLPAGEIVFKTCEPGLIKARLALYALNDLEISSEGKRPNTRYGIRRIKVRLRLCIDMTLTFTTCNIDEMATLQ
jgi:hypothetical protein